MKKLPLEIDRAEKALRAAVDKLVEQHVRDRRPIYVWRDGKVVDILPEELQARSEAPRTA